jgi:hypothetical protein
LKILGSSVTAGVIGGLMTGLTPYGFGLVNAGHLNKIFAMAYVPWILASVLYFMKKRSLKSICILSLVTSIQLWANHPQIVYYTWMVIGFYFVWNIVTIYKEESFSLKSNIYQF